MRRKLPFLIGTALLLALFATDVISWHWTVAWARHYFFRAKATAEGITNTSPVGNTDHARTCRENLHRLQAAKRKTAFDRGQQVGPITWEDVLRTMGNLPARRTSPRVLQGYMPRCPGGGTYILGKLEEVPRCTIGGQGSINLDDDHIIRD